MVRKGSRSIAEEFKIRMVVLLPSYSGATGTLSCYSTGTEPEGIAVGGHNHLLGRGVSNKPTPQGIASCFEVLVFENFYDNTAGLLL